MSYEIKSLSIKNIFFDVANPRHDPSEGQQEALQKLLKDENIRGLASDIVKYGINPSENLIVMAHPEDEKKYVVLEGNRRLAALKLLEKPTLCSKKHDEKYFFNLSKKFSGGSPVRCTVVASRDEAHHWIVIKHVADQGGAAPKRWTATQNARYAQGTNTNSQYKRAYSLLKYALDQELISKEEYDQINITTINRYLTNPAFRKSIGIDFRNNWIQTNVETDKFNEVIHRFLMDDLAGPANGGLSSRSKAADCEKHGEKLLADFHIPDHRRPGFEDLPKVQENSEVPSDGDSGNNPPRQNRNPNKRSKVIPYEFRLKIERPKIKRIYDELKQLDATKYPNAAAFLFRGFIELSVHYYLEKVMNQHEQQRDLHKHILSVAKDMEEKGVVAKKLKPLRAAASTPTPSSPLCTGLMNNYIHGVQEPSPADLMRAWDPIQESVQLMYEEINKNAGGQEV